MRVIAGQFKGRRFHPPDNIPTRPTTDFAKTGLFNILNNEFDFSEISYLDLFAGTGSLSYEFASRGCPRIVSVERDHKCQQFILKMKTEWKIPAIDLFKGDVFQFINNCREKFDVIFAGPPYALETIDAIPDLIFEKQLLNEGGWFIMETDPRHKFENHTKFLRSRNYGTTIFSIFEQPITNTEKS